jgi:hypothetical protein
MSFLPRFVALVCLVLPASNYFAESLRALVALRGTRYPVVVVDLETGVAHRALLDPAFRRRALIYAWLGIGLFAGIQAPNVVDVVRAALAP